MDGITLKVAAFMAQTGGNGPRVKAEEFLLFRWKICEEFVKNRPIFRASISLQNLMPLAQC